MRAMAAFRTPRVIRFVLDGRVPSKKNAWRRKAGQKAYLPDQIQADIDALVIQANALRFKLLPEPRSLYGKRLLVTVTFCAKKPTVDLDNAYTTLLDVLQKAQIIDDDKNVRQFAVGETIDAKKPQQTIITIQAL